MAFFFASEINRRSSNEDSYCQMEFRMNAEAAVRAMVVADGMGGLSGGKYYSEAAVNMWYQELPVLYLFWEILFPFRLLFSSFLFPS